MNTLETCTEAECSQVITPSNTVHSVFVCTVHGPLCGYFLFLYEKTAEFHEQYGPFTSHADINAQIHRAWREAQASGDVVNYINRTHATKLPYPFIRPKSGCQITTPCDTLPVVSKCTARGQLSAYRLFAREKTVEFKKQKGDSVSNAYVRTLVDQAWKEALTNGDAVNYINRVNTAKSQRSPAPRPKS